MDKPSKAALTAIVGAFVLCTPYWMLPNRSGSGVPLLVLLIAAVACMPWIWYFFLRRVAELRDAVLGRDRQQ